MRFVGIGRSPEFSPNSVARDAAILEAVAEQLRQGGHEVCLYREDTLSMETNAARHAALDGTDGVFSMGRSEPLNACLGRLHANSLNTPRGLRLCADRSALMAAMQAQGLPQPSFATHELSVPCRVASLPPFPLWAKRAEGYSQHASDVVLAHDANALLHALAHFAAAGCRRVVLSAHARGDLIKFYGVAGTAFFRFSYATAEGSFSKFGWETHNDAPARYAFDANAMQAKLHAFAEAIGVPVYGGDAIIQADGTWLIIDFNDWPSFATYRHEAAAAIAQRLVANTSPTTHP